MIVIAWASSSDAHMNTIVNYFLFERTGCKCSSDDNRAHNGRARFSSLYSAWASPFEHDSVVFPVCKNQVQALKRLKSCTTNIICSQDHLFRQFLHRLTCDMLLWHHNTAWYREFRGAPWQPITVEPWYKDHLWAAAKVVFIVGRPSKKFKAIYGTVTSKNPLDDGC